MAGEPRACPCCGTGMVPVKASTYGMFDTHLFDRIPGSTPEEVVENWRWFNESRPHPATVGGEPVSDMGPLALCPVTLLAADGKDVRRVGPMVFYWPAKREQGVAAWLEAVNADPDARRLLALRESEPRTAWWPTPEPTP